MFRDGRSCSREEVANQICYLAQTPVSAIAQSLSAGESLLVVAKIRSVVELGSLKTLFGQAGAIASPSTAYINDWNLLPIGQVLWLKELESYNEFPPLQDPASYNLSQVLEQVRKAGHRNPSE